MRGLKQRGERGFAMLQIKITALELGVHTFELEPTPEAIGLEADRFSDIRVDVRLERGVDQILASFTASAVATLECDRTLQLFEQRIRGSYVVLFASPELIEQSDDGGDGQDIRPLLPADQEIDLAGPVRDTLLLAIPTRKIAPGAEALDLPTQFGAPTGEDAVDPRWEALKGLRDRNE